MYRQFNIQQFYVLPTQCIYVCCVDLRTNSSYFPIPRSASSFLYNAPRFPKVHCFRRSQASPVCADKNSK